MLLKRRGSTNGTIFVLLMAIIGGLGKALRFNPGVTFRKASWGRTYSS